MMTLDTLKREFEKIVDEKNPIMLQHRGDSDAWHDCYYSHPNSTQAKTLQKRVAALAKVQPELAALLTPIVDRLIVKQAEIEVAKVEQAKAREARKAKTAANQAEREATKANPYRKLHPQVAELMREVAEPYRVKAYEQRKQSQLDFVNEIKAAYAGVSGSYDPRKLFPDDRKAHSFVRDAIAQKQSEAYRFINVDCYTYSLKTDADIKAIIEAAANRFADDLVTAFVYKVGTKLSGIVELKGNLSESKISGSLQDHWMTFTFADGSSFQVQSQIVWKRSINGLDFTQYPTCFRNVVLADGSEMKFPSEKKMKDSFASKN